MKRRTHNGVVKAGRRIKFFITLIEALLHVREIFFVKEIVTRLFEKIGRVVAENMTDSRLHERKSTVRRVSGDEFWGIHKKKLNSYYRHFPVKVNDVL